MKYKFNGIETDENGGMFIPRVIDGHLPLKAGDTVEFPGSPRWTAPMDGMYLFGRFMMGPLETYVFNGVEKEFGYGAVFPSVPVRAGDIINGFLVPVAGLYNIRDNTFKESRCECGELVEAAHYSKCKACWWAGDPRNPANRL